ncbi:MAG: hypothetical protein OXQ84_10575 [bacterium]|nr:hypothetical protein [bacterium]
MRQIFSDDKGTLSSFRVMAMIALVGGLGIFAVDVICATSAHDYELVYAALFGTALGGKAAQKKFEG